MGRVAGGKAELPGEGTAGPGAVLLCWALPCPGGDSLAGQKVLSPFPSLSPHAFHQAETSQMSRLFKTWLI